MPSKICDQKGIVLEGDAISIKIIWNRIQSEGSAFLRPFLGAEGFIEPLYLSENVENYVMTRDYLEA